jgi:hypothetical protein
MSNHLLPRTGSQLLSPGLIIESEIGKISAQ